MYGEWKYRKNLKRIVAQIAVLMNYLEREENIDGIVVKGMSGIIPGTLVSQQTDIPLVVVREGEKCSHSYTDIEKDCVRDLTRYVLLDDFVETGETLVTLMSKIAVTYPSAKCVGAIFWSGSVSTEVAKIATHIPDFTGKVWSVYGMGEAEYEQGKHPCERLEEDICSVPS